MPDFTLNNGGTQFPPLFNTSFNWLDFLKYLSDVNLDELFQNLDGRSRLAETQAEWNQNGQETAQTITDVGSSLFDTASQLYTDNYQKKVDAYKNKNWDLEGVKKLIQHKPVQQTTDPSLETPTLEQLNLDEIEKLRKNLIGNNSAMNNQLNLTVQPGKVYKVDGVEYRVDENSAKVENGEGQASGYSAVRIDKDGKTSNVILTDDMLKGNSSLLDKTQSALNSNTASIISSGILQVGNIIGGDVGKVTNIAGLAYGYGKNALNGDLIGAGTQALSSVLGTSDNSKVRALGQLAGNAKSAINSIKTLTDASKYAKESVKLMQAGKTAQQARNLVGVNNVSNLAGIALSVADTAIFGNQTPDEYSGRKGGITQGLDTAYDVIQTGIGFVPGIGTLASAIMTGNKFLGHGIKAMGGGTDGMTTADAILGSSFLQATPLGMINGFGGKTTSSFTKDEDVFNNIGGSYLGSNALADASEPYAGKKFGLFSDSQRRKWENKIQDIIRQQNILRNISSESERAKTLQQTMTGAEAQSLTNSINGGYRDITFAKKGALLSLFGDKLNRAHRIIIETKKTIIIEPTQEEKEEKETKNVIPEGALHANLNNMDTEDITRKGIPVIDNDGEQQAEIERDEIIFRLEVTKLIEQYKKDGSDEAAIKAGKLLTEEILYNTEDRTGLLEKFKQGGTIQTSTKGSTVNVIPEGALHARKNNMEGAGEDFTHKGIPVVDNDGELQAEIELNEIIFRLEVTKKLEELKKKDTEEAEIEAGKLLVDEILYNTDDRTGLIQTI